MQKQWARPASCHVPAAHGRQAHALSCNAVLLTFTGLAQEDGEPASKKSQGLAEAAQAPSMEQQRVAWCAWANQGTIFMHESGAPGARQR